MRKKKCSTIGHVALDEIYTPRTNVTTFTCHLNIYFTMNIVCLLATNIYFELFKRLFVDMNNIWNFYDRVFVSINYLRNFLAAYLEPQTYV